MAVTSAAAKTGGRLLATMGKGKHRTKLTSAKIAARQGRPGKGTGKRDNARRAKKREAMETWFDKHEAETPARSGMDRNGLQVALGEKIETGLTAAGPAGNREQEGTFPE